MTSPPYSPGFIHRAAKKKGYVSHRLPVARRMQNASILRRTRRLIRDKPWSYLDTYKIRGGEAVRREVLKVGPRRPRRRYNRNVELVLGILVIVIVIVLLVRLSG